MACNVALRGIAAVMLALPILSGCQAAQEIDAAMRRVDVLDRIFEPAPDPAPQLVLQVAPSPQPLPRPAPPEGPAKDALPAPAAIEPAAIPAPIAIETAALPSLPPAEAQARADPALRHASLIRDNPWLVQFWSELNAGEQGRVTRAMQRSGMVVGTGPIPATWDRMGLSDRVRLVFGEGR